MHAKLFLGVSLSLVLGACASYQPSAEERRVAYPLDPCDKAHRDKAQKALTAMHTSLTFSADWVCVTPPVTDKKPGLSNAPEKVREESQALDAPEEDKLRQAIEEPFLNLKGPRPVMGVALAGGGSKAAAFATGVLAGLADEDLLDSANYISSVSGGSYAAYFYYTHRIFPLLRSGDRLKPSSRQLYWDCVLRPEDDRATKDVRNTIGAFGACDRFRLTPALPSTPSAAVQDNRYQAFLRCQQDMFRPGVCSTNVTSKDFGISKLAILGTLTLFPVSNVANTLFDWGVSLSPSAHTCRDGIGVGYGTTVTNPKALRAGELWETGRVLCSPNGKGYALDCVKEGWFVKPEDLTFQELRAGLLQANAPGQTADSVLDTQRGCPQVPQCVRVVVPWQGRYHQQRHVRDDGSVARLWALWLRLGASVLAQHVCTGCHRRIGGVPRFEPARGPESDCSRRYWGRPPTRKPGLGN